MIKGTLACVIHAQRSVDAEAESLARQSRHHFSQLGPRSPWDVRPHLLLAEILIEQRRFDEADMVLRPVHEFLHQKTPVGNYYIGLADSLLGAFLAGKTRQTEAEPLLVAGLENLRKSRGDHHRLTRGALDRLVAFHRENGRDDQADQCVKLLETKSP